MIDTAHAARMLKHLETTKTEVVSPYLNRPKRLRAEARSDAQAAFIEQIARFTKYPTDGVLCGDPAEDAMVVLNKLIDQARKLTKRPRK